ncbi:MAG: helix-turn-helix domain-containing protein [Deltaproteobacteria bacterium]|nr:helix-turn-helix domain-containing protein [Deltaproteobacteria bacterium]
MPFTVSQQLESAQRKTLTRQELQHLIERYRGNRQQIAKHLGIDRTTLWRWIKKYQISQ